MVDLESSCLNLYMGKLRLWQVKELHKVTCQVNGVLGWEGGLLPPYQSQLFPLKAILKTHTNPFRSQRTVRMGHPCKFYQAQSSFESINVPKTYAAPQYHSSCSLLACSQYTLGTPWERSNQPRLLSWYLRPFLSISGTGRERTDVAPGLWHRQFQLTTLIRPEASCTVLEWSPAYTGSSVYHSAL